MRDDGTTDEVDFKVGYKQLFTKILSIIRRTADTFYLGKSNSGISNGFEGEVYEMLIYNRVLTDSEIDVIQSELALRWNAVEIKSKEITLNASFSGEQKGTSKRPFLKWRDALRRIFRKDELR